MITCNARGSIFKSSKILKSFIKVAVLHIPALYKLFTKKNNLESLGWINLYINLACLSVCLYPINVKTAEPIGPKFFVGPHGAPGKVYKWSKFQIFVSIKIRSSVNFWKFWKSRKFFVKICELFLFCFTMYTKRTCSHII